MNNASDPSALNARIKLNSEFQSMDLNDWIFDHVAIKPGSKVLELCCGTGSQTLRLAELVGESGEVHALDVSMDALMELSTRIVEKDLEDRLGSICIDMDELISKPWPLKEHEFDLIFCSYGLYYSEDPMALLRALTSHLKQDGRIVIIGPFGSNNYPLFSVLQEGGVKIAPEVMYASSEFMAEVVKPYADSAFSTVNVSTLVNLVHWTSVDQVMQYWQNTTFYDDTKDAVVRSLFEGISNLENEKWIMLIEMIGRRS